MPVSTLWYTEIRKENCIPILEYVSVFYLVQHILTTKTKKTKRARGASSHRWDSKERDVSTRRRRGCVGVLCARSIVKIDLRKLVITGNSYHRRYRLPPSSLHYLTGVIFTFHRGYFLEMTGDVVLVKSRLIWKGKRVFETLSGLLCSGPINLA